jgi:LAO/AO transport system kinase
VSELALTALSSLDELIRGIRARQPRALARAITLLERGGSGRRELVRRIHPHTGHARVIGVTGAAGAGKSTLVDCVARRWRERGETVAILAVDPSSPYSGGALLGDRIRMQALYTDPGVFIRSMATRGRMGGLARATHDAVDVLDAAGFDRVLLETVGVGQDEVEIVESADTVLVVVMPGIGDDVQVIKAGLMEIADVFVLNKADRDGASLLHKDLEQMLGLAERTDGEPGRRRWEPPIVDTVASREEGIDELLSEIERHRAWLEDTGGLDRRRRGHLALRVRNLLAERLLTAAEDAGFADAVERASADGTDPYDVADRIFDEVLRRMQGEDPSPGDEP